jgi:glycosyltransferase involved in cell wall biosynthesis
VYPALQSPRLVFVGSLAQRYKGADVLLKAVHKLAATTDINLTMIGEGKHRQESEELARALEITDRVRFLGELAAGKSVRDELDRADLFVLPSRSEGLPRAMIEAMARALPCIGTKVGGIPELLCEDEMVAADDPAALALKIQQVFDSPEKMTQMSSDSLQRSLDYRPELLRKRRAEFYGVLRNATEKWLAGRHSVAGQPVLQERISA